MKLDVSTLMIAGAFVATLGAAALLFAWYQYRGTAAALWWSVADMTMATAIVILALGSANADHNLFLAGIALMCTSAALFWAGARSFDGHRIDPVVLIAGPSIWIAAHSFGHAFAETILMPTLQVIVSLFYFGAAAVSIRHGEGEGLAARFPMTALLVVHTATLFLAIPSYLNGSLTPGQAPPIWSLFGIVHFETMVFIIGTTVFAVAMIKERSELRYLQASFTDPLTGLPNRRAFFEKAANILERSRREHVPTAAIIFDLDRFKIVNDRFGHAIGDRTLQRFAAVCRTVLRPSDMIGRVGGEEFAVVLPGCDVEAGHAMGERVRKAFADAGTFIDGNAVKATVSAGIAVTDGDADVQTLLNQADAGLYRAKEGGRNRVERVDDGIVLADRTVIRIA